jgi:hypothetical protein
VRERGRKTVKTGILLPFRCLSPGHSQTGSHGRNLGLESLIIQKIRRNFAYRFRIHVKHFAEESVGEIAEPRGEKERTVQSVKKVGQKLPQQ